MNEFDPYQPIRSADFSRSLGHQIRATLPHHQLGEFQPKGVEDRDPVALIEEQNSHRLQDLVPLRRERMLKSPFSFYRGSAGLQAYDLSLQVNTGLPVVVCGDAHLGNFGLYSSPERALVFDLNDFDEAAIGPWEWDLYRLISSVVLAAEENDMEADKVLKLARRTAGHYRKWVHRLLATDSLDRYYFRVDETYIRETLSYSSLDFFDQVASKANRKTGDKAFDQMLKEQPNGTYAFVEDPPILTSLPELTKTEMKNVYRRYLESARSDIRLLLQPYQLTGMARRVVGVGSVGTRCYVLALTGPDGGRIVLQIKEARTSVIADNTELTTNSPQILRKGYSHGERVVSYQQILQAVSDPFLGYLSEDGHDYYVRQFRDKKGSFKTENMSDTQFHNYVSGCAMMLARAHTQSPNAYAIGAYIGTDKGIDHAFAEWSVSYAAQVKQDFERYRAQFG